MTVLPIVTLPDPVLRSRSEPIEVVDDGVRELAADLCETLKHNRLVGMAAIMVGIARRIAVVALDEKGYTEAATVMINPEIVSYGADTRRGKEACPSVPDTMEDVERANEVTVAWTGLDGDRHTLSATGYRARVIQHEVDLCDGILFIDRLSRLKRQRIEKRIAKAAKRLAE